jgi:tetratricopeptide (TPR) repeat protein
LKLFSWNRKNKNQRDNNQSIEHFLVDAIEAFEQGDFRKAIDRFELIVEAYPDHSLAYVLMGRAYIEEKKYEKAIEALYEHLKIVPHSVEAMIYLGIAYYEYHELNLAQSRFEEAMKLRSGSLLAKENLVITKISANHLDDALDDLIEIHKDHPNDKSISELLILTLGRLGHWNAAKQYALSMVDIKLPALAHA